MKKNLLVLLFIPLFYSLSAQNLDKLTLANEQVIMCTVKEVNKDIIFYKIEDDRGQIESYSIPFNDVLVLETDNTFISDKFIKIKVDKSVPARVEIAKSTLFFIGGAAIGIPGFTMWRLAESKNTGIKNHGQVSSVGFTMAVVGVGLAGVGFYLLKKAGDKLADKAYYFGPTEDGVGLVYTF